MSKLTLSEILRGETGLAAILERARRPTETPQEIRRENGKRWLRTLRGSDKVAWESWGLIYNRLGIREKNPWGWLLFYFGTDTSFRDGLTISYMEENGLRHLESIGKRFAELAKTLLGFQFDLPEWLFDPTTINYEENFVAFFSEFF
jgi:hypothetical protein